MSILYALFVGLVVGAIAKFLFPGRDGGGIVVTILLGVGGAVLASVVGSALGWSPQGRAPGIILSVIGAMLILGIYRLARRKNVTPA